jgi:OOP family OmpA-OmpF porin
MFRIASLGLGMALCLLCASVAWALSPFIVFFEKGSVGLTARTALVLDNAVRASRAVPYREVILYGHTDRSGDAEANLALSRRRAEAVRDALLARGMQVETISIEVHGETRPLVETADGVDEPQNRRVEIVVIPACGPFSSPARDC